MSTPHLEDRLRRLAGDMAAPPTDEARAAIARRAGRLRRRRAVAAAGTGALALALAAGLLARPQGGPGDVQTDMADPDGPPAFTIDDWTVVAAQDDPPDGPRDADGGLGIGEGSFQVFRTPGDLSGPSVFLRHEPASDAQAGPGADEEAVTIGDVQGYLRRTGPAGFALRWNPGNGDSSAALQAWRLTRDQVLAFARGLRLRDPSIHYPPTAEDAFGFVAGDLPAGIEEIHPGAEAPPRVPGRRVVLERDGARAEITVDRSSGLAFEAGLGELFATAAGATQARAPGTDAVLVEIPDGGGTRWHLAWQTDDGVTVDVVILGVNESGVDEVIAGLREVPAAEWQALVDSAS